MAAVQGRVLSAPGATSGAAALRRWCPPQAVPAVLWLVLVVGIPIGIFFLYGFWSSDLFGIDKVWNLEQYERVVSDSFYRALIARTILLALAAAALAVALGYGAAYALSFRLRRWQSAVLFVVVAAAFASFLVRVYAWLVILGPEGPINRGLDAAGLIGQPLDFLLYTPTSVLIALVSILLPFAVLPIYSSMQAVDRDVVRASRDLGAGPLVSFVRVVLPLTWPGVVVGFVLVFILAMGDYVTPQLVGGKGGLMAGRVVFDQFGTTQDWSFASALSFTLIAAAAATLGLLWAATRLVGRLAGGARIRTARKRTGATAALRRVPWSTLYLGGFLLYVIAPLAIVILFSFSGSRFASFPIDGLTLGWYGDAFGSGDFRGALANSVQIAAVATVVALGIGVPAAFALARQRFRLRAIVSALVVLPLAMPGVVLGLALLTSVRFLGGETSRLTAVVGQATLALPLVVLVMTARIRGLDRSLEDAGRDLGCTRVGVLRRVTAPLVATTLVAVAVLAFAVSMDEFVVTNLTIGEDRTLPVHVWGLFQRQGTTPVVNAIATVLIVATATFLVVSSGVERIRGRVVRAAPGPAR